MMEKALNRSEITRILQQIETEYEWPDAGSLALCKNDETAVFQHLV